MGLGFGRDELADTTHHILNTTGELEKVKCRLCREGDPKVEILRTPEQRVVPVV
jgi:hypothetical protein